MRIISAFVYKLWLKSKFVYIKRKDVSIMIHLRQARQSQTLFLFLILARGAQSELYDQGTTLKCPLEWFSHSLIEVINESQNAFFKNFNRAKATSFKKFAH